MIYFWKLCIFVCLAYFFVFGGVFMDFQWFYDFFKEYGLNILGLVVLHCSAVYMLSQLYIKSFNKYKDDDNDDCEKDKKS